jgi:hypothetical protein
MHPVHAVNILARYFRKPIADTEPILEERQNKKNDGKNMYFLDSVR